MTTLMTSTNASLPKVSYVKSLDIFLGVCFFIVFASLLEYAAIGYLMKRCRRTRITTRPQTTCYYELAEQSAIHTNTATSLRRKKRKHDTVLQVDSYGGDQSMPLLSNHSSRKLSVSPIVITSSNNDVPTYLRIRPSQVDLLSRIVFPTFFIAFHIVYWSIYLNL
uniref:Neurotransmitter-gated ion-channel transmembrane domain-containing protein n=1 Tax=Parascaris univalens TaxID=6257 RepID=A0A915AXP1_PARUN